MNGKLYRPRHIWNDYRPCLDRVSTHYRPTIDRYIDRLSTECRPTIDRLSTDYRPLYRPIDRSTLPTVNMIRLKQRQIKYCVRAFQNQLVNVQSACTVVYVVCLQCRIKNWSWQVLIGNCSNSQPFNFDRLVTN